MAVHDAGLHAELVVQRLQRGGAAQRAQERLALLDVGGEVERRARLGVELRHAGGVGAQVGVAERRRLARARARCRSPRAGRPRRRRRSRSRRSAARPERCAPGAAGRRRSRRRSACSTRTRHAGSCSRPTTSSCRRPRRCSTLVSMRRADRRALGRDVRVVERVGQPVLAVDRPDHERRRRQGLQRRERVGGRHGHALQHEHGVGRRLGQPRARGRAGLAAVDELRGDDVHRRQRGRDRGGEAEPVGPQVDAGARLPERPVRREQRDPRPAAAHRVRPGRRASRDARPPAPAARRPCRR